VEVRRSKGGKAALVLGGNNYVKFVTIGKSCPVFATMARPDFLKEYNKVLSMPTDTAAYSFIKAAKSAVKHSPDVINFLMEQFILKNVAEMTLAEVTLRYNNLCVGLGKKPRKSFDSKRLALEALEKLDAEVKVATPAQATAAEKSTQLRSTRMTDVNGEVVAPKVRGKGIGARAMELLSEGKSTKEVIEIVKAEIPDANPTPATIAWYKNKLRQEGKLAMPVKTEKAPKVKKTKEAPVDETEGS